MGYYDDAVTLGKLVEILKKHDPTKRVKYGFTYPHSYRGYYECVAFEPADNICVGGMLESAKGALGMTFVGWKGGDFPMDGDTTVFIAFEGSCGDRLEPMLLRLMLELESPDES